MDISPQTSWKRKTRLAFVLFCICTVAMIVGVIIKLKAMYRDAPPQPEKGSFTTGVIVWAGSLVLWLGVRWYYKLLVKNK